MRKRIKQRAVLGGLIMVLVAIAITLLNENDAAYNPDVTSFTGKVGLGGSEVPEGTTITAVVNGDEYHTQTPTIYGSSHYYLVIEPPEGVHYPDGAEVIFRIDNTPAAQTSFYKVGTATRMDLTSATTISNMQFKPWVFILAIVGLLMALGLIAFLLHVDWALKKYHIRIVRDTKAYVPSTSRSKPPLL